MAQVDPAGQGSIICPSPPYIEFARFLVSPIPTPTITCRLSSPSISFHLSLSFSVSLSVSPFLFISESCVLTPILRWFYAASSLNVISLFLFLSWVSLSLNVIFPSLITDSVRLAVAQTLRDRG